jgi:hypothetical protein
VRQDPTAPNREAVGNFLTGLLPERSPLKQSINAAKAEAEAKKAEAEAQAAAEKAKEERLKEEASMMSQGAPAQVPAQEAARMPAQDLTQPIAQPALPQQPLLSPGLALEAQAQEKLGQEQASLLQAQQAEMIKKEAETESRRQEQMNAINDQVSKINSMKIEPKGFFEGKSTGQKVAAGIGLFFAALTPQGAQNAIKIIDDEIERDLSVQKANLSKEQNTLSNLEKQLGSIDAAETAFRLKATQNLSLKLQEAAAKAQGPMARAKALQGQQALDAQSSKLQQELAIKLMEKRDKKEGQIINTMGFIGVAPTKEEAVEFRKSAAAYQKSADSLDELISMVGKGKSISPSERAKAQALTTQLRGSLRLLLIGSGAMSDMEQQLLKDIIADPTKIMSLPQQEQAKLETLKKKLGDALATQADSLGIKLEADNFEKYRVK